MSPLDFWGQPQTWPRDPLGYVFLARAVDLIGRANFGDAWNGKEVTTACIPSLPVLWEASNLDKYRVHQILMESPEYAAKRKQEAETERAEGVAKAKRASRSISQYPPSLSRPLPHSSARNLRAEFFHRNRVVGSTGNRATTTN
jgi:hypothetical protein